MSNLPWGTILIAAIVVIVAVVVFQVVVGSEPSGADTTTELALREAVLRKCRASSPEQTLINSLT